MLVSASYPCLTGPKDVPIVPNAHFGEVTFRGDAKFDGAAVRITGANGWKPELNAFPGTAAACPDTRALVLC